MVAFVITKRWCISLQRHDNEKLLHGYETGIIMRSPEGGYSERHLPISEDRAYTLTARERDQILPAPSTVRNASRTRDQREQSLNERQSKATPEQNKTDERRSAAYHLSWLDPIAPWTRCRSGPSVEG